MQLLLIVRCVTRLLAAVLCAAGVPTTAFAAAADLPLEGERTIRFSTQEASWMSVDVAPSGETLLMDVLGDLYSAPVTGGTARRLTSGMAFDSQPVWSPDGHTIAFVSDRAGAENVWLMDADGSNLRQLTREDGEVEFASPRFSPDGGHIIVSRTTWGLRTFELWAYHLEGGKGVQVTTAKAAPNTPINDRHNALGAVYSNDGRYLYYARRTGGFGYNMTLPAWQIARRDLQDGREDVLTEAGGSAMRPVLSPDDRFLVYGTRHRHATGLRIRDLHSGHDRWLTWPVERDEQESRFTRDLLPGYGFSPDGRTLYASRDGRVHRIDVDSGTGKPVDIRFDIDQMLGKRLHFPWRLGIAPAKARVLMAPALAANGRALAFSAFGRIYVHDLATNRQRAVSPEDQRAYQPAWSPDGRTLVYVSWSGEGGHLWQIAASGGAPRRLTAAAAYYTQPVFTPDGQEVVVFRGSGEERLLRARDGGQVNGAELIRLSTAGQQIRVIAPAGGLDTPHFGPERDRIYVYRHPGAFARSGSGSLESMRLDGSDRRTHLQIKGPGAYLAEEEIAPEAAWISPDGGHVLVRHANQLYMIRRLGNSYGDITQSLTTPALPQVKLTDVGADSAGWTTGGEGIFWTTGARFQQRPLDSVVWREPSPANPAAADIQDGAPDATANSGADRTTHAPAEDHPRVRHTDIDVWKARQVPAGTLALVNATLHTMEPGQEPVHNGVLVVHGDRISAVGTTDSVEIPPGAEVLDLEGRYVLPGFIDTHAHYGLMRGVLGMDNPSFLANLAYGVTTGIDVQPSTVDILAYQDLIDAGVMTGPRALSTGPGIFSNNAFKSAEHAGHVLRRYRDHYGVHNLKAYLSGNRRQRQWLAQAAANLQLMPTTEGGLDMKLDLTHIIDGFAGNEHNFPLLDLHDDVVRLTAESRIAYTPTLLVAYGGHWGEGWFFTRESPLDDPKLNRFTPWPELASRGLRRPWAHDREHVFSRIAAQARKIVDAGGYVGVGAHGQLQGLGFHWEMWALHSGGMTNQQVLAAATRNAADMIGVARDLGTLSPGKLADLVVLDADPMTDIRHTARLNRVMKGGVVYTADTLDEEWPEPKALPHQWWWNIDPPGFPAPIPRKL